MHNIKISNDEGSPIHISSKKLNSLCRACLKQSGALHLFGFLNKQKDLMYSDVFTLFSLFQAEQGDGFPQYICQDCANFVTLFYSFKQTIKESQIILQLLTSEINNVDNSESFKNSFVTTEINQSNIASTNADLIFDIFNRKVRIEITNDNKCIWFEPKNEPKDNEDRTLQVENIDNNNDNYMRLEDVNEEENRTFPLDHDYAKICNVELVCPFCSMKFSNRDEFISHRITEFKQQTESNEEFKCLYCNLKFNSRNDFLAHMKKKSEQKNPIITSEEYICPLCNLKFYSKLEFLKHRREERDDITKSVKFSKKHKRQLEYTCSVCNINFNSRAQYILHRKEEAAKTLEKKPKVITEKEFTCSYCSLKFDLKREYMQHRKEEAKKTSECTYCKKVMHTSQLDNHLRLIHKKLPPLECDICKRHFVSSTFYKNHMLAHRDGFFCEICGKKCFSSHALTRHKKSHDKEKTVHACETCGKTFKYSYLLSEHINTHTGEKPFLCSSCGAAFSAQTKLHQHTLSMHTERPFKCQLCDKNYDTEKKLNQHVQRHENEKDNVCHKCGSQFLKKSSLSLHLKYHDREGNNTLRGRGRKRMHCLSCKKEYNEIVHFQMHIRSHLGESPYLCLFCGKQFYDENEYNIHSKQHNRTLKPIHQCDFCSKIYASNAKLTNHIRSHTGERPFQCNQCGNCYQSNFHLKRHSFLHTGLKPFSCKYCGKTFRLRENCRQHERIHQGSGEYICSLCGKSFYTGSSLRKHLKIHMKEH